MARETLRGYPGFYGEPGEDAQDFVENWRLMHTNFFDESRCMLSHRGFVQILDGHWVFDSK